MRKTTWTINQPSTCDSESSGSLGTESGETNFSNVASHWLKVVSQGFQCCEDMKQDRFSRNFT